jgi:hypothetical protein
VRKLLLAVLWVVLVAVAVWYAVTRLALRDDAPGSAPSAFAADAGPWPVCTTRCGTERWAVKTLADPTRLAVDFSQVVDASVAELAALDPRATTVIGGWRHAPVETTVYRVDATLVALFGEEDHDWHLVLADTLDPRVTMIAEIPDPSCPAACTSGYASYYDRARSVLMAHTDAARSERHPRVRVTGVGFFDFPHGQRGAAPNGIEIHPVLAIEFP